MEDLIRREDAVSRKGVSAWLCNVGQTKLAEAVKGIGAVSRV